MKITEIKAAHSPPCLLSLFYKSTKFCCYYDCIQIKVDPLQIWLIEYIALISTIKNDVVI